MSRWRIDFVVQELDVPPEQARGIKFGDDLDLEDVIDFFERCRDAVRTLLGTKRRQTLEELRTQVLEEKKKAEAKAAQVMAPGQPAYSKVSRSYNEGTLDDAFARLMNDK